MHTQPSWFEDMIFLCYGKLLTTSQKRDEKIVKTVPNFPVYKLNSKENDFSSE